MSDTKTVSTPSITDELARSYSEIAPFSLPSLAYIFPSV